MGGPVTSVRSKASAWAASKSSCGMCERSEGLVSRANEEPVVERRDVGLLPFIFLFRLSVLPCKLLGGVSGCDRAGRSVGRKAAGTYIGDLGWRSWRVARGREGNSGLGAFGCGEAGEFGEGVWGVEVVGE